MIKKVVLLFVLLLVGTVGCQQQPLPAQTPEPIEEIPDSDEHSEEPQDSGEQLIESDLTITVYADQTVDAPYLFGLLHGITYDDNEDYSDTVSLIEDLKPQRWILATYHNNVHKFVNEGSFIADGTEMTFSVQGAFNAQFGYPIKVNSICGGGNCYGSYDELKTKWLGFAQALLDRRDETITVTRYNIFAEPNHGWEGVSYEQQLDLFRATYDLIRTEIPDAKIEGPDLGFYDFDLLKQFVEFSLENNMDIDTINWHELNVRDEWDTIEPHTAAKHVDEFMEYLRTTNMCNGGCPDIHIGEYSFLDTNLIPGWEVGWLYHYRDTEVDMLTKACWDTQGPNKYSTCWDGFGGLFLENNKDTQGLYWVHKAYADFADNQVKTESEDDRTVAIAGKEGEDIIVLVGSYADDVRDVTLAVQGVGNNEKVVVEVHKIPDNNNLPVALSAPEFVSRSEVYTTDRNIAFALENIGSGDAFIVRIREN